MAIALDATSNSGAKSNVTSITWSHTCTGSNLVLVVGFGGRDSSTTDMIITGVTYNGVALTKGISEQLNSDVSFRSENWYLIGPATGTHDIVITLTGTVLACAGVAISLTGCDQASQPDGVDSNSNPSNLTLSLGHPIGVSNSWVMSFGYTRSGAITADTGTDFCNLPVNGADDVVFASYEGPIASTGDHTVQWTETDTGNDWSMTTISIGPSTASAATNTRIGSMTLMGVGN